MFNYTDLTKIKVLPIKSVFLSKFLSWEEDIVQYLSFECKTDVESFYMNDFVLIRILDILLDNAYEEVHLQTENQFINIAIIDQKDSIEIVFENSLNSSVTHFKQLLETNYTTKENHTGLGLSTVKKFVDESSHLHLFSSISKEKCFFSITLLIEKKGTK